MTDVINVLSPLVTVQDAKGNPVANGSIEFYEAETATPKTVYADRDLTTELGPTVATDDAGYPVTGGGARTLIYTGVGDFKMIVRNSLGATIVTHDNVPGAVAIPTSAEVALPQTPVISKTSTYSVVSADRGKVINANPTSGSFAITLPSAVDAADGFRITIRHAANSTNVVTIRTTGGDVIGIPGKYTTSFALKGFGAAVTLVCDGAGWIVDSEVPPAVLDGIPYLKITDRLAVPPTSPTGGARYIINGSPTGAWATLGFAENQIAESNGDGSWFSYTPDRGWFAYVADENVFTVWNGAAWADQLGMTTPSSSTIQSAVFEQQYPNGSGGGSATTGAWTKRSLDVTVKNTISGCSLSSGQIVLPVGTHFIFASQESYLVAQFQSRIAVVSGSATPTEIKSGASNLRVNDSGGDTPSVYDYGPVIAGIVTVTATATIELQYWAQTTAGGTSALGFPSAEPGGTNEVYARVTVISLSALQGPAGPGGPQGADGLDAAYPYQWSTLTSGDPGSGKIRLNHATPSSATELAISETNSSGGTMTGVIASWDDSTSSVKGTLKFATEDNPEYFVAFRITGTGTDQGAYWTFPVTYINGSGTIINGDDGAVIVLEKGDKGDTGPAGPTGATGPAGPTGAGTGDVLKAASSTTFAAATFLDTTGSKLRDSNLVMGASAANWAQSLWFNQPSGYTPAEFAYVGNNADGDAFFQLRSGVPAGTQRRMYFSWLDTNNNICWHFGKNPGDSIILFDYQTNTHRMQLNTHWASGTPTDGVTYINSGGSGAVIINGFGESGTGTGGLSVQSGTASPTTWLRVNSLGQTSVGTASPDGSAQLDVTSTTRGLLPPRMTTAQRTAISSPTDGLVIYDNDLKALMVRSNSTWRGALGKQYYCLANLGGTNQTGVASGVYTKVNLSNEVSDADSAFNNSTYRYTAAETGLYYVRGSIGSNSGYKINSYLWVNGVNTIAGSEAAASSSGPSIVSAILPLTAGDYVELYGLQSTGTDAFWGNVAQTNFSACMIR